MSAPCPCPCAGSCLSCDALILRNVIMPTVAILTAEAHAAQGGALWCCPICGGLNAADGPLHGFATLGWCQHERCASRRDVIREFSIGTPPLPEILFPAAAFDRRPLVLAG